jgi:ABC-type proline/glycine betaine transport system ATPase subunit
MIGMIRRLIIFKVVVLPQPEAPRRMQISPSGTSMVMFRRGIGYVIQQIGLFPNMTVEENVCVVPDLLGWDRAKSRGRAAELGRC